MNETLCTLPQNPMLRFYEHPGKRTQMTAVGGSRSQLITTTKHGHCGTVNVVMASNEKRMRTGVSLRTKVEILAEIDKGDNYDDIVTKHGLAGKSTVSSK